MLEFIVHYWVEFVFSLIISLLGLAVKKINKKMDEQEALKMGVQALLRDRIIQSYNYHMEKEFIPIYARENLDALSKEYYNLGGNGVVHQLMDKLGELPTKHE